MSTDRVARRTCFEGAWKAQDTIEWYERTFDYNVSGGKLNCGMSVVDTVEIIQGILLTDDGYLKAAVLGWGIAILTLRLSAPNVVPRLGRHDGFIDYASRPALLVPLPQSWLNCDKLLVRAGGCDILSPQEAFA
ncbi:hypothetical protein EDD18DRAFT_1354226 [Armillaria luteobubalina]|uniref:Uncharacterized protein n=1 Tax=Armillaria luteobubalina TaxID=153913 RepID=A0AA39Q3S0_9AGAR|nr:hypothetical protein EDD18DRAFT_1354226 [Armillaria luteobubalina]